MRSNNYTYTLFKSHSIHRDERSSTDLVLNLLAVLSRLSLLSSTLLFVTFPFSRQRSPIDIPVDFERVFFSSSFSFVCQLASSSSIYLSRGLRLHFASPVFDLSPFNHLVSSVCRYPSIFARIFTPQSSNLESATTTMFASPMPI